MVAPATRSRVIVVLLRKLFSSPRDPFSLRFLRELVSAGWVNGDDNKSEADSGEDACVFKTIMAGVLRQMKVSTSWCRDHQRLFFGKLTCADSIRHKHASQRSYWKTNRRVLRVPWKRYCSHDLLQCWCSACSLDPASLPWCLTTRCT